MIKKFVCFILMLSMLVLMSCGTSSKETLGDDISKLENALENTLLEEEKELAEAEKRSEESKKEKNVLTHADGSETESFYNADGKEEKEVVTDADGNKKESFYKAEAKEEKNVLTDADGNKKESFYKAEAKEEKAVVTDADGNKKESFYNAEAKEEKNVLTDADGSETEYFYNADGKVEKAVITDPDGSKTELSFFYNADGKVEKEVVTHADGSETEYEYLYNAEAKEEANTLQGNIKDISNIDALNLGTVLTSKDYKTKTDLLKAFNGALGREDLTEANIVEELTEEVKIEEYNQANNCDKTLLDYYQDCYESGERTKTNFKSNGDKDQLFYRRDTDEIARLVTTKSSGQKTETFFLKGTTLSNFSLVKNQKKFVRTDNKEIFQTFYTDNPDIDELERTLVNKANGDQVEVFFIKGTRSDHIDSVAHFEKVVITKSSGNTLEFFYKSGKLDYTLTTFCDQTNIALYGSQFKFDNNSNLVDQKEITCP